MTSASIRRVEDACLLVSGDLVFSSVKQLLQEGERLILTLPDPVIDLAGVEHCDSAGLALLLEWIELSAAAGVAVSFRNLPESLRGIARLSNAENLLPMDGIQA